MDWTSAFSGSSASQVCFQVADQSCTLHHTRKSDISHELKDNKSTKMNKKKLVKYLGTTLCKRLRIYGWDYIVPTLG